MIKTTKVIEQFTKSNVSYETYGNWRFHRDGLFSENLFGPLFDYTCACGIVRPKNEVCPICNVKSESSITRFIKTVDLEYPFYFVKPIVYIAISQIKRFIHPNYTFYIDNETKQIMDKKISGIEQTDILYDHLIIAAIKYLLNQDYFIDDKFKEHFEKYREFYFLKAEEFIHILNEFNHNNITYQVAKKIFFEWPYTKIVTNKVRLLPAGFRYVYIQSNNNNGISAYSNIYNKIYLKLVYIYNNIQELEVDSLMFKYLYNIQKSLLATYTEEVLHYMTKKKGLYRQQLLGRRVDLSFRAVLVGDPELFIDEIGLSYYGFTHIAYFELLKALPYNLKKNIQILNNIINTNVIDTDIKTIMHNIINDPNNNIKVLLMRQPVLHLPSTQEFKIKKIYDDLVIKMNQVLWAGYNADSDGDTVVIFRLLDNTNKNDNYFHPKYHLLTPKEDINLSIEYDSLAGLIK